MNPYFTGTTAADNATHSPALLPAINLFALPDAYPSEVLPMLCDDSRDHRQQKSWLLRDLRKDSWPAVPMQTSRSSFGDGWRIDAFAFRATLVRKP
jgi:hypothetical protein